MNFDLVTWASLIEVPVFAALFRLVFRNRRELDEAVSNCRRSGENGLGGVREALADFKLHVARNYVSVNYLKDVENRLTGHLLRIEKKLDEAGRNHL